jgi:hypothetical protein
MKFLTLLTTLLSPLLCLGQATQPVVVSLPPSTQPSQVVVNVPPTVVQVNPSPTPAPSNRMLVGTNIDDNTYISGSARWADVTHQMTGWFGAAGGTITKYDANGYPQTTGGTGAARAFTYLYGDYPSGNYTATWVGPQDGLGFTGGKVLTNVQPNGPNNAWKAVVAFNNGDRCEMQQRGGVTDIHLISPDATTGRMFRDAYLARLIPYRVCRLMPIQHVNGNGLPPVLHTTWSQRTIPTSWDQTSWEVALEFQAELCRESGTIPWICLPYGVDDATVIAVAQVFVTFPIVYVEFSNELWNTAPAYQGMMVRNDALAMGTYGSGDPNVAGARRAAELSARVGSIFKQTIGPSHVKVVFGAQATWDAWAVNGLGWVKPGDIDALAIAPYFQPADSLINPTVPQVLASCDKWIDQVLAPNIAANYKAAEKYGIPLWTYEGGQHLLPSVKGPTTELQWQGDLTPAEFQKYLADPFRAAQVDAGIGPVYDHLFKVSRDNGVTLFCNFMLTGPWGRSGWWGLTQSINAPPNPKTQALDHAIAVGN